MTPSPSPQLFRTAVWVRDFYSLPIDAIKDIHCELTLLRGKVVFDASATKSNELDSEERAGKRQILLTSSK